MIKAELRDRFIELRDDLSADDVRTWTDQILKRLTTAVDWSVIAKVHSYKSVLKWKEVDTSPIADMVKALNPDIQVAYGNPDRSTLRPNEQYDVIIVPLLAFDKRLNRIGFGGGWYDRFLAKQVYAIKIGLAYDIQQSDEIPIKAYDIPLDMVITQSRVITK